jgi:arsenate reductase (glutaredoxin)
LSKNATADIIFYGPVMFQLIGKQGCRETRKAERFLRERGVNFSFVDLDKRDLSPGELKSIMESIPPGGLIDRNSRQFDKRGLKYMDFDPAEEISADQKLIITPLLRIKNRAIAGFDETEYKKFLSLTSGPEGKK